MLISFSVCVYMCASTGVGMGTCVCRCLSTYVSLSLCMGEMFKPRSCHGPIPGSCRPSLLLPPVIEGRQGNLRDPV